jgi:hypothetical protein
MSKLFESARKIIFIAALICSQTITGIGQGLQPPIPVELFFGHEALYSQLILARGFSTTSKFSLFSLATYSASYNEQDDDDLVIINQINYSLGKGFEVMGGVNMNAIVGLSPVLGPMHVFASRKFLSVSILSYFLNGDHDLSLFGLYEFKPPINDKLSVYTRLQFLFEQSLGEGQHNRSFMYLRVGLKKSKFSFGFGANLDQYDPQKEFKDNYGAFVGWEF